MATSFRPLVRQDWIIGSNHRSGGSVSSLSNLLGMMLAQVVSLADGDSAFCVFSLQRKWKTRSTFTSHGSLTHSCGFADSEPSMSTSAARLVSGFVHLQRQLEMCSTTGYHCFSPNRPGTCFWHPCRVHHGLPST